MNKIIISNTFHMTEMTIILPKEYSSYELYEQALSVKAYCDNDKSAKRKLSKIKSALCPHIGCTCEGFIKQK